MLAIKGSRPIGHPVEVRVVRGEEPRVVRELILLPVASHEDVAAGLAVQKLEYATATITPRLGLCEHAADRRRCRACGRACPSGAAFRVDAHPEPSCVVEEVVHPERKRCHLGASPIFSSGNEGANQPPGAFVGVPIRCEDRAFEALGGERFPLGRLAHRFQRAGPWPVRLPGASQASAHGS